MSMADEEEERVFNNCTQSLISYDKVETLRHRHRVRQQIALVPPILRASLLDKWKRVELAIRANAKVLNAIIPGHIQQHKDAVAPARDQDKVRSTLKQFVRDWSEEGAVERNECYNPILAALESHFPVETHRQEIKVLVPGAGLGRLMLEIARRGFATQGNEFSFHMLLASDFVLNSTTAENEFTIYPYIHSFSNHLSDDIMLRQASFPDILPRNAIPKQVDFSMVAGEFLEVYMQSDQEAAWDVVVTCFFIDTAHNVADYIQCIHRILKPGGLWINLGPLLYHYEDMQEEASLELSLEHVLLLVNHYGFVITDQKTIQCSYANDAQSMLQHVYQCAFFQANKEIKST